MTLLRWPPHDGSRPPTALVVLLHGVGADASQMDDIVETLAPALPGTAFLAPDGPFPFDQSHGGQQWFSLRDRTPARLEAGAATATPLLDAIVDAECERLALPPDRVVLAGFSQGAMMALYAGLRRTPAPLAILGYAGALLDTPALAAALTGRPPILLVHGEQDQVVPFPLAPMAESILRRLGFPVETCWRPGLGHSIDAPGLQAGLAFLQRVISSH